MDGYSPENDPGVRSVTRIYNYYKRHGYATTAMEASFRNSAQILQLAGCNLLTIAPQLMEELSQVSGEVPRQLDPQAAARAGEDRIHLADTQFRWEINDDAMATEKLAEGIRGFAVVKRSSPDFLVLAITCLHNEQGWLGRCHLQTSSPGSKLAVKKTVGQANSSTVQGR